LVHIQCCVQCKRNSVRFRGWNRTAGSESTKSERV